MKNAGWLLRQLVRRDDHAQQARVRRKGVVSALRDSDVHLRGAGLGENDREVLLGGIHMHELHATSVATQAFEVQLQPCERAGVNGFTIDAIVPTEPLVAVSPAPSQ